MNNSVLPATAGMDTIAAIATPPGTAGIAVIRVSGDRAVDCAATAFRGADLRTVHTHTVHYGKLHDESGRVVDEVLAAVFRAPGSYTGEDSVELSCHGGAMVTQSVLRCLLVSGARHAEPGEFTRRAFLNGRLDLVQAEAVADMIHAQTREAHRASLLQLEGVLSGFVREIRGKLLHAASMLELSLDFVEEDVAFMSVEELHGVIDDASRQVARALDSFGSGRLVREGVRVALLGKPNVGKSSLLNVLLGTDRAIVTDVPGTTRDFIEEPMLLRGELFRFIDTAGLRSTDDIVEREGIARTHRIARHADIVCLLGEATGGTEEIEALRALAGPECDEHETLNVFTKCDLVDGSTRAALSQTGLPVSAIDGSGLDALREALTGLARRMRAVTEQGEVLVTNARHADCLRRSHAALKRAAEALKEGMTEEFVALDVRESIDALGEMIGEVTSDDVLNGIFARFCIGK